MHRLRDWFWIVSVGTISICAILAARAANHLLESAMIHMGPTLPRVRARRPHPILARSKDPSVILARDMFCSTCDEVTPLVASGAAPDGGGTPRTALPLALIAVFNDGRAGGGVTMANTQSGNAGLYVVGDLLPGAGTLRRVGPQTVAFWNDRTNRLERVDLVDLVAHAGAAPTAAPTKKPPAPVAVIDPGIVRVDAQHFQVDRALLEKVLGDPAALGKQARVSPVVEDGQAKGFKVSGFHADSLLAQIGLENGDVIGALNGTPLTSADKLLEAYASLRSASSVAVTVARSGAPLQIEYAIR